MVHKLNILLKLHKINQNTHMYTQKTKQNKTRKTHARSCIQKRSHALTQSQIQQAKYKQTNKQINEHTYAYTYTHSYTNTLTHTHIHIQTLKHTQACANTQTQTHTH